MSKYSKLDKERMVEEARRLYIKGFDVITISKFVGVSEDTIRKWVKEYEFDISKRNSIIQRPQIMEAILKSFQDVLDGKKPNIKPLDAAQYASAFEKLSDKKKLLSYTMEAYNELTDEVIAAIEKETSDKQRKYLFEIVQLMRIYMDKVVGRLSQEVIHD